MNLSQNFELAAGSVPGSTHLARMKNNHDAYQWVQHDDLIIAIITDGCGSMPHSEVGAKIGALLTLQTLERHITKREPLYTESNYLGQSAFWHEITYDMLAQLRVLGNTLHDSLYKVLTDYFLFTIVGVILTPHRTCIFSLGDGYYALNGNITPISPPPGKNQPYLAYHMTGFDREKIDPISLFFQIHETLPTQEVDQVLIGSDGVRELITHATDCVPGKQELIGELSQFWLCDTFFTNPTWLQSRLTRLATSKQRIDYEQQRVLKYPGIVQDDTTMVTIRSRNASLS